MQGILIKGAGPLAAPSANLSGRPSPTCAQDVLEDLEEKIPLILDGGTCTFGIESTVISLAGKTPQILRLGSIAKEEIEKCLGIQVLDPPQKGPALSPGMRYRHYAPKARVRMAHTEEELKGDYILLPEAHSYYANLREADRCGAQEVIIDCRKKIEPALLDRIFRSSNS